MSNPFSEQELISTLLASNVPDSPFTVTQLPNNKLEVMWNLVDTNWIHLFGKSGLKEIYKIIIRLDDRKKIAYYTMVRGTVSWKEGIPTVSFSVNYFRGQVVGFSSRKAFGIRNDGSLGKLYDMNLNFNTINDPVEKIISDAGWQFKRDWYDPITFLAVIVAAIAAIGAILSLIINILR